MVRMFRVFCLLLLGFSFAGLVIAQEKKISLAKDYLEKARSHDTSGDPRAEEEYRQAIALRDGIYPEAWRELSAFLSKRLRFADAAEAFNTSLEQKRRIYANDETELTVLRRAAELQMRYSRAEVLSSNEMLDFVKLIDQYGRTGDAVPYAEKTVALYPESARALIALAFLIKWDQRERALELLNHAVALQADDPSVYVARGWGYYWCQGDGFQAEIDFRKAIELSKGLNASAWQGLGDALAKQGRKHEAIAAYRKYLAIRPQSASHYDGEIKKSISTLQSLQP